MLNKDGQRELCYVVTIDEIKEIPGRDFTECAVVNGWTVLVKKNQFKPGDLGIYFEIDSKVPEKEPFLFLAKKHYKIKTQKYKTPEGQFWSQGLLMHPNDFNWIVNKTEIIDDKHNIHHVDDESRFLTKQLEVTYAIGEDNKRKRKSADKYQKMAQRHKKKFSKQPYRWLMRRNWGKKLLFIFFGKKKDKRNWPEWVKKTDEERVQNMPWILKDKNPWIVTEKIDGSSTTFTMKRKPFGKYDFFVCSRNVVFEKPNQPCYYDSNIYLEMAKKYDIENKMKQMMEHNFADCEWITIQGETFGEGIQKRDYSLKEHQFEAFNFITSKDGRYNSRTMKNILTNLWGIPTVPILDDNYILPDTIEELLNYATGESTIDLKPREGIVLRYLDGSQSFKVVSNEYLMKYHN